MTSNELTVGRATRPPGAALQYFTVAGPPAIRLRKEIDDEWVLGLSGTLSILFGALIMYRPDAGLIAMALLIGAYMLAIGILGVALSLRLRKMCNTLGAARAQPVKAR